MPIVTEGQETPQRRRPWLPFGVTLAAVLVGVCAVPFWRPIYVRTGSQGLYVEAGQSADIQNLQFGVGFSYGWEAQGWSLGPGSWLVYAGPHHGNGAP